MPAKIGHPLSSEGRKVHAVRSDTGLRIKGIDDESPRYLGRSLCDRVVEVRDLSSSFDRERTDPRNCKRCVVVARSLNGSF